MAKSDTVEREVVHRSRGAEEDSGTHEGCRKEATDEEVGKKQ